MSFVRYKDVIENGDTVILFLGFDNMLQFTVDKTKTHQTRYGALRHCDLLGVRYGSKVQCSKGFAHILHPTAELWTQTLPHRTQILYSTDISLITLQLDLKPGSIVVESGTGSGSLSHAILRTIVPGGYLHTFDFHEQRVEKAKQEFLEHAYGDNVTVLHRDVLQEGFDLEDVADAVFLDLPAPWDAVPHSKKALKPQGGRLCSFSPCIEQVQRVCEKLLELSFSEIQTVECLLRPLDVRTATLPMPDLGFPLESHIEAGEPAATGEMSVGGSYHHPSLGRIEIGQSNDKTQKMGHKGKQNFKKARKDKRGRRNDSPSNEAPKEEVAEIERKTEIDSQPNEVVAEIDMDTSQAEAELQKKDKSAFYVFKTAIPPFQMPGHTGYLTFATLYPK